MWRQAAMLLLVAWACWGRGTNPQTNQELQLASDKAVMYLRREFSPIARLLRESPETGPNRYWLATDNSLASWALTRAHAFDLAMILTTSLIDAGDCRHGLIEALLEDDVDWPPHVSLDGAIARMGDSEIRLETRLSGATIDDWREYADLALYEALYWHIQDDSERARQMYANAISTMFDRQSMGFSDKAYRDPENKPPRYDTYKLALAIYTAKTISTEVDNDILRTLLNKQAVSGGFVAKYDADGHHHGDTNTETTSYALLALERMLHSDVISITPPAGVLCRRVYLPVVWKFGAG